MCNLSSLRQEFPRAVSAAVDATVECSDGDLRIEILRRICGPNGSHSDHAWLTSCLPNVTPLSRERRFTTRRNHTQARAARRLQRLLGCVMNRPRTPSSIRTVRPPR